MPAECNVAHPNSWISLENRHYRRELQYSSGPNVRSGALASCLSAAAPNAGPIALIPNAGWGITHSLSIHTLSGEQLHAFERLRERSQPDDPPFRAVALGWSVDDLLSIVYNDGVLLRLPGGADLTRVRLLRAFQRDGVYDATVLHTGDVVIRTEAGDVYRVDGHDKVRKESFTIRPPDRATGYVLNATICAISPDKSSLDVVETIAVTESNSLVLANSSGVHPLIAHDHISHIAISPNGKYVVAMDNSTGNLVVLDVERRSEVIRLNLVVELSVLGVENLVSEELFDAKEPDSVAWVGSDAIALLYKEHIILVGPKQGLAVLALQEQATASSVILSTEQDGLRLISGKRVEFLQMVPELITSVLCQRQAPSYKLLRSSGVALGTDAHSMKAITRYRMLRELREAGTLVEAARNCVSAAYLELDVMNQKRLLLAASYGQRFATVFADDKETITSTSSDLPAMKKRRDQRLRRDSDMIPAAIAVLRVLNAASSHDAGVPLTKTEFDTLGLPGLVARLSRYGKHTLALRLASFGGISPYDALSEWSAHIIRSNLNETDEHIKTHIAEKFEAVSKSYRVFDHHGSRRSRALPYVHAAEAAYAVARPKCAELLLRLETRPAPKVKMFLKMGREKPAIVSAVASGDPELVLDVLGVILESKSVRDTAKLIRTLPPSICNRATDLFASHLKQIGSAGWLKTLYSEVGRWREAAMVDIQGANQSSDPRKRLGDLEMAVKTIGKGPYRRACHFEVQAVQHAAIVAANAIELEKKTNLEHGALRYANDGELLSKAIQEISNPGARKDVLARLRRELRIPGRRFFWICLSSMADAGDFEGIEGLSSAAGSGRAPPIGFTAFVDTCLKYGKEDEAVKYASKIIDLRDRARALARCGRGREAADIASRMRNQQLLEEVQDLTARHVNQLPAQSGRETRE
ncbi:hypothetical protein BWQ96_04884 [Gracilariopsis chorda]|uniref:Vacuolar protein sorting-associated protein 16 homolog n=1 Tax=Gracilariopsis chorda TaxID=448386 RepID=A0A2V3ITD0_9FLOR|nr:hypothetical protein BWQ96_04884 [Gracilariopsis chorda]|eukprot:PXF45364.1 hypothetical protein BWQ96_04884 [Gracilariopsis chorda]